MSSPGSTIAVLDDEPKMRTALRRLLGTHDFSVEDYESGRDFLAALPVHPVDCLVLDLHLPEMNGFEVLEHMAAQRIALPVVVVTAHDDPGVSARVRGLGAAAFLTKPVDESALVAAIESAIAQHRRA